jgi:hypothetical protein
MWYEKLGIEKNPPLSEEAMRYCEEHGIEPHDSSPPLWRWLLSGLSQVAFWVVVVWAVWRFIGFGNAYTFLVEPLHFGIAAFVIWWLAAIFLSD